MLGSGSMSIASPNDATRSWTSRESHYGICRCRTKKHGRTQGEIAGGLDAIYDDGSKECAFDIRHLAMMGCVEGVLGRLLAGGLAPGHEGYPDQC